MILGIGIDLVEIARFEPWAGYSSERLQRVFTAAELADCCDASGALIAEKLAARYAAKEAFYKAVSASLVNLNLTQHEFGLLAIAPLVGVVYGTWGVPVLRVEWVAIERLINKPLPPLSVHLSLSHEHGMAAAMVTVETGVGTV